MCKSRPAAAVEYRMLGPKQLVVRDAEIWSHPLVIVPHVVAQPFEPVALRHVDNSTLDAPTPRNAQRSLPGESEKQGG